MTRLAAVLRGGLVESIHFGAVAVVAPGGALVALAGDPTLPIVTRSTIKPFQALPLVLAGGIDRFGLDDADLALICSSHGGTPAHVARARSLLGRGGFEIEALGCGVHRPMDANTARRLDESGEPPGPLHNNCSGKHAGMLLACAALDLPAADYLAPEHPLQRRIEAELAACCGLVPGLRHAVDGCSAPTFELPLAALARGWAAVAGPSEAGLDPARARALDRLARAMGAAPEMVAGPGRFTTALARATCGRVLGKEGAEALYAIAIRGPHPLGAAFKIVDGGDRARDTIALELLGQLGALSGDEQRGLAPYYRPLLRNHRGLVVGEIVSEVEIVESSD